jgi:hypothetical protein
MQQRRAVEDWTLRSRREDGILFIEAHGIATAESLRTMRAYIGAAMAEHEDKAVLVDFRGARAAMNDEGWRQAATDSARAAFRAPVAMLVDEADLGATLEHCRAVARLGFLRMAFTSYERAFAWVAAIAAPRRTLPAAGSPDVQSPRPPQSGQPPRLRLVRSQT